MMCYWLKRKAEESDNMKYVEMCPSRMEDFDQNGKLTMQAILQMFENVGNNHSTDIGEAVIDTSLGGIAWILTEWRVEVLEDIAYQRRFQLETWSKGASNALLVERDYLLKDVEGHVLAKGEACFVLIDVEKRKPIRVTEELVEKYQPELDCVWEDEKFPRMREEKAYSIEREIQMRRTDIDFNQHVHNLTYVDYVMEMLPEEVYKTQQFKKIRIAYRKAFEVGEKIVGKIKQKDQAFRIGFFGEEDKARTIVVIE